MRRDYHRCLAVILTSCSLLSAPVAVTSGELILKPSNAWHEVFERVDFEVQGVPMVTNPYNADSISLDLQAARPSGKVLYLPGFYYQNFDRKFEGDHEVPVAQGQGGWRIHWLP